MRYLVLVSLLAAPSACFLGLDDKDAESIGASSDTTGSDSESATTAGSTNDPSASGPDDTTVSTSASMTSTSSTATSDPTSAEASDSDTASESSTGEPMAACESGPLAGPIPGCAPPPPPSTGDSAQDCVDRINQFRWECQCLPPLARWADAEQCTDQQAANDQASQSPHGNFGACGEWAQNTCPDWGSEEDVVSNCLQAMWDEGPGEPFEAHGHYINMSSSDYTKVACGFSASGSGVWANQNFSQ